MTNAALRGLLAAAALIAATFLLLPQAGAKDAKSPPHKARIETAHGSTLDVVYHPPAGSRGTAVVIAPGQGYHMDLPLIVRCAERLSDEGFFVVRFNWGYFAKKGKPSADLKTEQADLEAVVAWIRKTDGVKKVILAGKSLGSLVVLNRAGEKHDDIAGVGLLTFPIHDPGDAGNLWVTPADIDKVGCPMMIALGDRDPLASLPALYGLVAKTARPAPIVVAPGEHSFRDPAKKDDSARTAEHLDVVIDAFLLYCKRWSE
jgi:predicted alpha/beta-hydrolase family hydrolase